MKKICPHCKQELEFEKHQQFGSHITNCKMNPKRSEIIKKITESKKVERIKYEFKCVVCDKKYELILTENDYIKNKYKKCCSEKCSNQLSHSKIDYKKTKTVICVGCSKEYEVSIYARNENNRCNKCGNYKSRKHINYNKVKNGLIKTKKIVDGKIVCKICGQDKCKYPKICNAWISGRDKTFIKFGFDTSKLDTLKFYDEYNKIIDLLRNEYKENSLPEIGKKYNVNFQTIHGMFNDLNIKTRSLSESGKLSYKKGNTTLSNVNVYPYKSGYHTTWDDNDVWYRSSYELDYCKKLDNKKTEYEMESLRFQYYDTQQKCERTAIPDFYLPKTNEIVEIKSSYTYDKQNMKDKIKSYLLNGYNFKLILEGKEVIVKKCKNK